MLQSCTQNKFGVFFSPVLKVQFYSWDKDCLFCNLGTAFEMMDYLFYSNQTGLIGLKLSKHSS